MKIYLSTWLTDRTLGNTMTKKKGDRRLLSYFFLISQNIPVEGFRDYCTFGRCDVRKNKKSKT
jgi:CO dehydrogenase/acetyl-CoA synthase alpha subunit